MPESARRAGDSVVIVAASIYCAFAMRVAVSAILSILRCDEADLDDTGETGRHEGVSEDSMHL